jgi:hypothetical protein
MSINNPNAHDFRTAHFYGLGNIQGDPEALQDIGIPIDADDHERHLTSAKRVKELLPTAIQTGRLIGDHEQWVDGFHLTHPSSEGPIVHATDEQRAATTANVNVVRANIRPYGERSGN